jgi:hypothetical protein
MEVAMFGKSPRRENPKPAKAQPPTSKAPKARDLAREDADSRSAIPVLPPQNDGS